MSDAIQSVVVVHFDADGELSYHVFGDESVRLFIVDERAPNDRVYEWLPRGDPAGLRHLIPQGSGVGSSQDKRHVAIAARVKAIMDGRAHLSAVPTNEPSA